MASHEIQLQSLLSEEEREAIDSFGMSHKSCDSVAMQQFLNDTFALELCLDVDIVQGFVQDSSNLPGKAFGLCRPVTEKQCAVLLRTCFVTETPCTVSAGKSNLTGSATPAGGVLLSVVNMNTPAVVVDAAAGQVVSPVGIILEEMREAVFAQSGKRFVFPVDPTSRADAAVGGVLACNASGFTPGEHGAVRHWVEEIHFLLPNGQKIQASRGQYVSEGGRFILCDGMDRTELPVPAYDRPAVKNAGGPFSASDGSMDFIDFVIGSEGLFGLVTACTCRLKEAPQEYLDLFFSLPDESDALRLRHTLSEKLGNFDSLTAFEYFGVNCRQYMEHEGLFFSGTHQVGVNIQVPLYGQELEEAAETWLELLLEADCGIDEDAIILLDNDRVRKKFMEARHSMPANALEVVQHRGTFTIMTDTVVPDDAFAEFLSYTHGLIRSAGIDYLSFGHIGDCHLHFTILPEQEQLEQARGIYDDIVAKSAALGGVYSGEHGTGKRKRADFLACYGPSAVEAVKACKRAIDPAFLLNRGNVFSCDDLLQMV